MNALPGSVMLAFQDQTIAQKGFHSEKVSPKTRIRSRLQGFQKSLQLSCAKC